eukprot:6212113-Pleurochrysis_carterae.AAC.4
MVRSPFLLTINTCRGPRLLSSLPTYGHLFAYLITYLITYPITYLRSEQPPSTASLTRRDIGGGGSVQTTSSSH